MTLEEFKAAVRAETEPNSVAALSPALRALWHEARGEWDAAHAFVQDETSAEAAWVHAYLHRKEGDAGNAAYWYARARKPVAAGSPEDEWCAIARDLTSGSK